MRFEMFPADCPTLKLLATDIAGKGSGPNWLFKLDLLLLWPPRFSLIISHQRRGTSWRRWWGCWWCCGSPGLLYPEDLAVVKGEDSARSELEVGREADGLVLVHHDVLLVRHQVQQHVLLSLLHVGGRVSALCWPLLTNYSGWRLILQLK